MDSFAYGEPAGRGPNLRRTRVSVVFGVVLVAAIGYGVFGLAESDGEAPLQHVKGTTEQIDTAGDLRAQANLRTALSAATTAFIHGGSFASASATDLSVLEPSFSYVDGSQSSTDPNVISVRATDQAWGGAVLSDSGTCFYMRSVGTTRAYGTGDVCTGEAAIGATGASF